MPSKACPVCFRSISYKREDWNLISRLPSVVCSRKCAFYFIEAHQPYTGYLKGAVQMSLGQPDASYSELLGTFFRSEYERYVAEALSESGIPFEYEKWSFPVKGSFYTPDFHLPEHKMFIEVKGAWGASAKSKVLNFLKLYPKTSLLLLPWTIASEFYPKEIQCLNLTQDV